MTTTATPDFASWKHETLVRFAHECWQENVALRQDLRTAIDAYRALIAQQEKDNDARSQS